MYNCLKCPKKYQTLSGLSKHTKNKHPTNFECKYCKKTFNRKYNMDRHIPKCTHKEDKFLKNIPRFVLKNKKGNDSLIKTENKLNKIVEKYELKSDVVSEINEVINELEIKDTYNKINNKNINFDNNNGQFNEKGNNIQNNQIQNNIQNIFFVNFGDEDLVNKLSDQEQNKVLNKRYESLEYLIDYVHANKNKPEFQNVIIPSLTGNNGYKYNSNDNEFKHVTRDELLNDLIENRMSDIEDFFNKQNDKMKKCTKERVEKFIKKMTVESEKKSSKFIDSKKDIITKNLHQKRGMIRRTHKIK